MGGLLSAVRRAGTRVSRRAGRRICGADRSWLPGAGGGRSNALRGPLRRASYRQTDSGVRGGNLGRFSGATLEIYDWDCGQALASCLLIDFLRELCVRCSVRRVTLIEPSPPALERGTELLTRTLGGSGYIRALCASFGHLTPEIVRAASAKDVKIHLFSNILDVEGVDS